MDTQHCSSLSIRSSPHPLTLLPPSPLTLSSHPFSHLLVPPPRAPTFLLSSPLPYSSFLLLLLLPPPPSPPSPGIVKWLRLIVPVPTPTIPAW